MNYEFDPFEDNITASLNDQPSVNEQERAMDNNNKPEETLVEGETVDEDEEDSSTEEGDSDSKDDEDYFVDEDTYLEEVNVVITDYHFNIDAEVEWVRHSESGQEQDHDPIPDQTFPTAAEVKERVRLHSIKIRRKLFLEKNDKLRIRAKCLGRILVFTLDGEGPSNTEEVTPTKKTTKVKGKKDVGPSDPVGPNKKCVSLGTTPSTASAKKKQAAIGSGQNMMTRASSAAAKKQTKNKKTPI
nr:zinc finger, SWIM-type [Tanacetum cinerariifolium]